MFKKDKDERKRGEMKFEKFLADVAPYVVLVGSYGRNEETESSDMDFYVRRRPQSVIDKEMEERNGNAEESYMGEIIKLAKGYQFQFDSVIVGNIAIERQPGVPIMLEFATHYRIPCDTQISERNVFGTRFLAACDDKHTQLEDTMDYELWNDAISETYIAHPLPPYEELDKQDIFPYLKRMEDSNCTLGSIIKMVDRTGWFGDYLTLHDCVFSEEEQKCAFKSIKTDESGYAVEVELRFLMEEEFKDFMEFEYTAQEFTNMLVAVERVRKINHEPQDKKYLVQIQSEIGVHPMLLSAAEIISKISMNDAADEEVIIYDVSTFGGIEPLICNGTWHDFNNPLYISVVRADGTIVFDGYGEEH